MTSNDAVLMVIKGLMLDPSSSTPIVLLRDEDSSFLLPIWIGASEANAIALRIEGVELPRPMTHDLLRDSLETLGATVEKILISDLKDNTFYAQIHISHDGLEKTLDSRPSDAIALALRTEAPIFASRRVLDKADALELARQSLDEDGSIMDLDELDPKDFGKYEM